MRYDPKQPVSIHNPYPQQLWPFKKGQKVYYLVNRGVVGCPWIAIGRVKWFNPALHQSMTVTKGRPFVTVEVLRGTDFGSAQVAGVEYVASFTRAGRRSLVEMIEKLKGGES